MLSINQDDIRRIARQLDAFYTAMRCFVYYSEIKNKQDKSEKNIEYWNFIEFTLLYTMLINWNKVYGISSSGSHWKEITFEQTEYIDKLYQTGKFTYVSWSEYRNYIHELSNNFISFPDPYHHKNQTYKFFGIKISLEVTHNWLYELTKNRKGVLSSEEADKWPIENKKHIDELKNEIHNILINS